LERYVDPDYSHRLELFPMDRGYDDGKTLRLDLLDRICLLYKEIADG